VVAVGVRAVPAREWRRSSACTTSNCVEVAFAADVVRVRSPGITEDAALAFTPAQWAAFLSGVRAGEFSTRTAR
jgi:uncharacterized protein DUF397